MPCRSKRMKKGRSDRDRIHSEPGVGAGGTSDYDRIHGSPSKSIKRSRRTASRSPWGKKRGALAW